jgi:hypothetical protein
VRADGVIVKPDVPLTPIDSSFINDSHNALLPMVAATYSDFSGSRAWYIFLYPQSSITQASFRLADVGLNQRAYLYDYFDRAGRVVGPEEWINKDLGVFRYEIAAPIGLSGIALLGDTAQFVTLGKKRITSFSDDGVLRTTIAFAAGESQRTLQGYAPFLPEVQAEAGTVAKFRYDAASGLFSVDVRPDSSAQATLRISRPHTLRTPVTRSPLAAPLRNPRLPLQN